MNSASLSRWDWLLLSVAIATLSGLVHWLVYHLATSGSAEGPRSTLWPRLLHLLESPWLLQPIRLLYAVGIPMLALLWQGALTSRGLGLKPWPLGSQIASLPALQPNVAADSGENAGSTALTNSLSRSWADDVGWFALVTAATVAVVVSGTHAAHRRSGQNSTRSVNRNFALAVLDAVVYEVHWAFYREPFVVTWGLALGSWLGAMPALLETAVNLIFWERLRDRDAAYARRMLGRAGLLVASCQLYLKTQNLWLAILMDLVVGWVLLPRPAPQSVTRAALTTIR